MSKILNKKVLFWIVSAVIVLGSIILSIVFCVNMSRNEDNKANLFNINCQDLNMQVGEVKSNYYTISIEDATITINVDKEGIIDIDEDKIVANKSGVVNVEVTAMTDGVTAKDSFSVVVADKDYRYEIIPVLNCTYGENLVMSDNVCYFNVIVYDKMGEALDDVKFVCSATNGAYIEREMGSFILLADKNCSVTLILTDFNKIITFDVVKTI